MPKKTKKTPAPKKGSKKNNKKGLDLDGSLSQTLQGEIVSTSLFKGDIPPTSVASSAASASHGHSSVPPYQAGTSQAVPLDKSDAILAYLERLDSSNQALTRCVAELESNRSMSSTPLNARTRPITRQSAPSATQQTVPVQHLADTDGIATAPTHSHHQINPKFQSTVPLIPSQVGTSQPLIHSRPQPEAAATQTQFACDGIVPSLSTLRQNQEIQAVNQVLSSYENQARLDATQGKGVKKSGRFNTTDAVTSAPHLRWPNEGLASVTGKKGAYTTTCQCQSGQLASSRTFIRYKTRF